MKLLLAVIVSGSVLLSGCHFHRYHHDYYIYDDLDDHPRYGDHCN